MPPQISGNLKESFVDYITLTSNHFKSTNLLLNKAQIALQQQKRQGNIISAWGMAGFKGFRAGQLECGQRGHEGLVRLSGSYAAADWFDFYQLADNVTRIDVQATVRTDGPVTPLIIREHKRAKRHKTREKQTHAITLWQSDDGGATLYLGSRSSEVYCRIYNKAVESGLDHYEQCARWELEFKGDHAKLCARILTDGGLVSAHVVSILNEYLARRGCSLVTSDGSRQPISCSQKRSDMQKTFRWLHDSVSPSIIYWSDRGYLREIIEALGLSTRVTINPEADSQDKPD